MKKQASITAIEPGILPVFRVFVVLQLLQSMWGLLRSRRTSLVFLSTFFPRLSDWVVVRRIGSGVYAVWTVLLFLLLLYLFLSPLHRKLKTVTLPLALIFQIVILVTMNNGITLARIAQNPVEDVGVRNWQMFVLLAVPILLAAWQYSFRYVLLYIVFSGVLDIITLRLAGPLQPSTGPLVSAGILLRTILYVLIGFIITQLMKEQRKQRLSLQEANRKLTHFASALDALATARERNRLARELHDVLAHTLSGLVIQLESINILWDSDPLRARQELQASATQASKGLKETRRAIKSLRASPLEDLGLSLSLRQAAEEAAQRGGFVVDVTLPDTMATLPQEIENDLYRLTLEAFENIVQHAHATHAALFVGLEENIVLLKISDDGVGFLPEAVDSGTHFGLLGLRERAELRGADFEINSRPGQGTNIILRLELPT